MIQQNICPFFKKCGGCLYQSLTEVSYLEKKRNFIVRAFADQNISVIPEEIIQIPLHSRRRATFAFNRGHLGYNGLKSHQIVDITDCLLLRHEIVSFLPKLREWIRQLRGSGEISVLITHAGLDIHIKTSDTDTPKLALLEQLALWAAHPDIARLSYNFIPILEKTPFSFPPDSFLQPSEEGENVLTNLMLNEVSSEKKAIDLFCGSGTFTIPLLKKGLKITGYDCADNISVLGPNGIKRDLFRSPLLPEEFQKIDLVVIDPPRSGAKAQIEQIAETNIPKIIMISCNPTTAARDSKILLNAGWTLTKLTPVDQFTWSNHIEIVCVFVKHS